MSRAGILARGWKQLGGGEAAIVPQARLSGPMPWVIAIMVAMTVIAAAAGLALRNTAQAAAADLEGGITVQVVEASAEARARQAAAVVNTFAQMPGVSSVRLVPREELDALVEPWLGAAALADGDAVPVPALVDVRLEGAVTPERIADARRALRAVAPSARVDGQAQWLAPVFDAIVSLQWLAIAVVALLGTALAAAVLLAVRTALGTNRDTIEIVHLLGGADTQIARVFQRSAGFDAAAGGVIGLLLALVVVLFLGRRFALLGTGMVAGGALGWTDWAVLCGIPVVAVLLAMLTARLTVLRALRRML